MTTCDSLCLHLRQGDFSLLEPAFVRHGHAEPRVISLHREGCFVGRESELAEALSCAAFLGAVEVTEYLLEAGVDANGGSATGLNALHWATNRGQVATTALLLRRGAALEVRNSHGGTVLSSTVWSAINEPRPAHLALIETLLSAGADVRAVESPTGHAAVDALLARFGAD